MQKQLDQELLEKYAKASNVRILNSQSDLDPRDRILPQMLDWCKRQGDVVVLANGLALTCNPTSRAIQNCKIVMRNNCL